MKPGPVIAWLALAGIASAIWSHELITVAAGPPRALDVAPEATRPLARFDLALPAVPTGVQRVRPGEGALLVHYWAPWEHDAVQQAMALDSLRRWPGFESLRVAVVCFDPFPSVARYVGKHRLRLPVLLDGPGELRRALPCPAIPYTYLLDPRGAIAARQAGAIDWLGGTTRRRLAAVLAEGITIRPRAPLTLGCPAHSGGADVPVAQGRRGHARLQRGAHVAAHVRRGDGPGGRRPGDPGGRCES